VQDSSHATTDHRINILMQSNQHERYFLRDPASCGPAG
jgi:hypothetical protein